MNIANLCLVRISLQARMNNMLLHIRVIAFLLISIGFIPSSYAVHGNWNNGFIDGPNRIPGELYYAYFPFTSKIAAAEHYCQTPVENTPFQEGRIKTLALSSIDPYDRFESWWVTCELKLVKYDGTIQWVGWGGGAVRKEDPCYFGKWGDISATDCVPPQNSGDQCTNSNAPVNKVSGNKYYHEVDYYGQGSFALKIERFYNSYEEKWSWTYRQRLVIVDGSQRTVEVIRPDGKQFKFTNDGNGWSADPSVILSLVEDHAGFQLTTADDVIETYDTNGRLLTITNRAGITQTVSYGSNQFTVQGVSDDYLIFHLGVNDRIEKVTRPNSHEYRFHYNTSGLLDAVSYPDYTPGQLGLNPFSEDNPYKSYHYEDVNFPTYVTGITDENGVRISTVKYDEEGRAIISELANGVERTVFDYSDMDSFRGAGRRVTVTNPLDKQTTYYFTTIHGVRKVTQVEGHPTTSCEGANKSYSYDANGNVISKTDWNGVTTNYTYDMDRNLELTRTEAAGTPQERTITTEWHADFRLPTKITEPEKVTEYSYDAHGRKLSGKVSGAY